MSSVCNIIIVFIPILYASMYVLCTKKKHTQKHTKTHKITKRNFTLLYMYFSNGNDDHSDTVNYNFYLFYMFTL